MKLMLSSDEATKEKMMLKCHNERCGAMKWLEDAIGMGLLHHLLLLKPITQMKDGFNVDKLIIG